MGRNLLIALLLAILGIQFSGGIGKLERTLPGALCMTLAPGYGDPDGMCSHEGGVLLWLAREQSRAL